MYQNKTEGEVELQRRMDSAKIADQDYRNLYWQLWGACSTDKRAWEIFEHITKTYLNNNKL